MQVVKPMLSEAKQKKPEYQRWEMSNVELEMKNKKPVNKVKSKL